MASRNSATYWVNAIKQLESAIKQAQPHNKREFQVALQKAITRYREIRHRAGIS